MTEQTIINKKQGFTQVENCILRSTVISQAAKLVYATLVSYDFNNKGVFPGQDRISWELNISTKTIQRAIKELEAWELITVQRRGLNKPNIYYIEEIPQKVRDMYNFTEMEWKIQKDMTGAERAARRKEIERLWRDFGWI